MDTEEVKRKNIIDMAWGFSAMTRVFEKKSTEKIVSKLGQMLSKIPSLQDNTEFETLHDDFCRWFENNIRTTKGSSKASYGQGAKVLDVALKVYVYYCHLPNPIIVKRISRWLHAAIDTKMLKYLRSRSGSRESKIQATTIKDINRKTYTELQKLVREDIKGEFADNIIPVQWDDIIWRQLNRRSTT